MPDTNTPLPQAPDSSAEDDVLLDLACKAMEQGPYQCDGEALSSAYKLAKAIRDSNDHAFVMTDRGVEPTHVGRLWRAIGGLQHIPVERIGDPLIAALRTSLQSVEFDRPVLAYWQGANAVVELVRQDLRAPHLRDQICLQTINERRIRYNYYRYLDALHDRYAKLLVVRLDLEYRDGTGVTVSRALADFNHLLVNRRHNAIFDHLVGYIRRLARGEGSQHLHFHVMLFFDGKYRDPNSGWFIAKSIGEYWVNLTRGNGIYYNCHDREAQFRELGRLGIGLVEHHDTAKRQNLRYVVGYLIKQGEFLIRNDLGSVKSISRGEMPKPPMRPGRPRSKLAATYVEKSSAFSEKDPVTHLI